MSESKHRRPADDRENDGDRPEDSAPARRTAAPGTAPWVIPTLLTLLLLGVAWIVVFYIAGYMIPFMTELGNWNLAIGMGLIAASFVVATQWK